jgi:hypothetical protein
MLKLTNLYKGADIKKVFKAVTLISLMLIGRNDKHIF